MMRCRNLASFVFFVLIATCLSADPVFCQSDGTPPQNAQITRLILKDGSFEPISQYSIENDRVRYFSTQRYVWEELPFSLIDWTATEQYARQATTESSSRMNEALAMASVAKKEEDARRPFVAPGLRLPSSEGVFLLDVYQSKSELILLAQNEADLNKNTGGNILRGIFNPIASSKQNVELKGLHARIQSHDLAPVIYFPIHAAYPQAEQNVVPPKDRFRIVQCENKKGKRIVAVYNIAIHGKVTQRAQYIEIKIEPVSEFWVKIAPLAPLKPGEYALVELDEKGTMNLFVWDFGADPTAPANPTIEMENPEKKAPVLIQKPRKKADS